MDRRPLSQLNWTLLITVVLLDLIGLVNLHSAVQLEHTRQVPPLFQTQVSFVALGLVGMLVLTFVDYRIYERMAWPLYLSGLGLLSAVLLFGRTISGSRRWLDLGFFTLQPSEPMKIFFVILLARYFHGDARSGSYGLRELVLPLLLCLPALALIFVSPDLGTTGFYLLIFGAMSIAVGLRWRTLAGVVAAGLLLLPLAYELVLTDYQRARVDTLLDPMQDPRGKGYQIIQARYAIGAGRLFGSGYEQGMQTHQGFIPENHTDFVVTVLAEEWGFLGCLVLLVLYFVMLMTGLSIAAQSKERFGALLAVGLVSVLFLQVSINLSAVLGLIPVDGVTLPFMSYGGSSILTVHAAMGLLLNISLRRYMF